MDFTNSILKWYLINKRDLPWRKTTNPYIIWLSEIMLQQTRVAQGLPFFLKFVEAFPTVFDLANANEESVLKLWQGLGYYSRARNLHATAKSIAFERQGVFPDNYSDLCSLKGVGEYTAAAIASFSFNEDVPVVDGNVFRVLARYFGMEHDISLPKTKKEFILLANEVLPKGNAGQFNQAIMEFGALQCVPKNPNCQSCPLNTSCVALQKNKVAELPVKLKKTKVVKRFFNYLVFEDDDQNTVVVKRIAKGIWHNLYEFPLLETNHDVALEELAESLLLKSNDPSFLPIISIELFENRTIFHKLSHQHLHIKFWKIKRRGKLQESIPKKAAIELPFPIVIYNFIEKDWHLTKK
jgi:A/G-specific adenine glycosylase